MRALLASWSSGGSDSGSCVTMAEKTGLCLCGGHFALEARRRLPRLLRGGGRVACTLQCFCLHSGCKARVGLDQPQSKRDSSKESCKRCAEIVNLRASHGLWPGWTGLDGTSAQVEPSLGLFYVDISLRTTGPGSRSTSDQGRV